MLGLVLNQSVRENGGATYQRANPTIRAALSVERRLHSTHTATGATNSTAAPNTQNTLVTSAAVQLTQFCTQMLYPHIVCWLVKANPQTKLPTMAVPKLGFLPKTTTSSTTIATVVCQASHPTLSHEWWQLQTVPHPYLPNMLFMANTSAPTEYVHTKGEKANSRPVTSPAPSLFAKANRVSDLPRGWVPARCLT